MRSRGTTCTRRWAALLVAGLVAASGLAGCSSDRGALPSPPTAQPTSRPTSTAAVPVTAGALGAKWDWGRVDAFSPYVRRLGGTTFYEVVWCVVEPTAGHLDWSKVDQVAQETRAMGTTLMLKLRVGACDWITGGSGQYVRGSKGKTESAMPRDLGAYASFVQAAVRRYAPLGVREFAVENEVNSPSMWAGSTQDLTRLLETASRAIRAADPQALVVDPGISSTAYGEGIASALLDAGRDSEAVQAYLTYYERRFPVRGKELPRITDAAGLRAVLDSEQGRRNLDYLAVARDLAQRHVVDVRQLHFYETWRSVPALVDYVRTQVPAGMPIEAWEVGQFRTDGGGSDAERAGEMTRTVALLLAGGVRRVVWLPLAFDPTGRHAGEPRYGLLDPDGSVRAAGQAFATLAAVTKGASVAHAVSTPAVQGVAFGSRTSTAVVLWSDHGGRISPPPSAQARSGTVGGPSTPVSAAGVQVGSQPVVLVLHQPVDQALAALTQSS